MCLDLNKEELQENIICLEKELFTRQRNASIHGVFTGELAHVKTLLDKMRCELKNITLGGDAK